MSEKNRVHVHASSFVPPAGARWRVGRSVGRTIYAVNTCDDPDCDGTDQLIGMMDTADLANRAVDDHNRNVASK